MKPCALIALGLSCAAQAAPPTHVEVSHGIEHLSNGSPDWRATVVTVRHDLQPVARSASLALALTRTERFGLSDNAAAVTLVKPVSPDTVVTADASRSGTHRILAKSSLGTAMQHEFAKSWLVHGGLRTTRYNELRVNQALLMLEHYTGPFSWAAGTRQARAFGTTATSAELRAAYYYGERHSVGIIVAAGREAANIGGVVTLTSSRSAALVGRHWVRHNLALTYSLSHAREGEYYNRNGVNLGLQAVF